MQEMNLTPEQLQQLAMMLRKQAGQSGMMNFDQNQWTQMMNNPAAREAGAEMAGLASEQAAMQMQAMGRPRAVPNGGLKSPFEAASEGLARGMGMYQMLNAQRAKADAIRNWPKPDPDGGAYRDGQSQKGPMQDAMALRTGTPQAVEVDTLNIPVPEAPLATAMPVSESSTLVTENIQPGSYRDGMKQGMPMKDPMSLRRGALSMTNQQVGQMLRNGASINPATGEVFYP